MASYDYFACSLLGKAVVFLFPILFYASVQITYIFLSFLLSISLSFFFKVADSTG